MVAALRADVWIRGLPYTTYECTRSAATLGVKHKLREYELICEIKWRWEASEFLTEYKIIKWKEWLVGRLQQARRQDLFKWCNEWCSTLLLPPHPKEKDLEGTGKMKLNFELRLVLWTRKSCAEIIIIIIIIIIITITITTTPITILTCVCLCLCLCFI